MTAWLRAIRPVQWVKNLLLLVPLFTSHAFDAPAFGRIGLAFIAFGCVASATYILNDIRDLQSDRRHPHKRRRPFAAGKLPVWQGAIAIPVLLVLGLVLAAMVSAPFLLTMLVYLTLTTLYSIWLKRLALVDVLTLAGLYDLRIIAGAAAIDVPLSAWLLAFSAFIFFSLALVKRDAELAELNRRGEVDSTGRDYHVNDYPMLSTMGIASGYMAVVVLALFINTPAVRMRYEHPLVLGLLCPAVLYWISRLWLQTGRGEMLDDPILWCLKDRVTWLVILAMIGITIAAI